MKIKSLLLTLFSFSLFLLTACQACEQPCSIQTNVTPGAVVIIVAPATDSHGKSFAEVGRDGTISACPGIKDNGQRQQCSEISVSQI